MTGGPQNPKWASLLKYLGTAGAPKVTQRPPNPHPPGVMRPGGAPEIVLRLLQANPERLYRRHALINATGATRKAIDWAVIFLHAQGLIDKIESPSGQMFRLARPADGRVDPAIAVAPRTSAFNERRG